MAITEPTGNEMRVTDKFGFRLGSKRSMAANLYERGATQAEMIDATGTTQYNMLKDAERRGHRFIIKGNRYWLVATGDGSGAPVADLPQAVSPTKSHAILRPSVRREKRTPEGEHVASVPAVLSVIGWHGDEPPEHIVARKSDDIAKAGRTLWVIQSWKAKTGDVQAFGRAYPGAVVYLIEGGAIPTGTSQAASQMSEDRVTWQPLPKGIGRVTGKLSGGTALVLDMLVPCTDMSIDLWRFAEHPSGDPVRFMRGASTACTVPSNEAAGMVHHVRKVVAIGRLARPSAVYLR